MASRFSPLLKPPRRASLIDLENTFQRFLHVSWSLREKPPKSLEGRELTSLSLPSIRALLSLRSGNRHILVVHSDAGYSCQAQTMMFGRRNTLIRVLGQIPHYTSKSPRYICWIYLYLAIDVNFDGIYKPEEE